MSSLSLTTRQSELLLLLTMGHSTATAAKVLGISTETAKSHLKWAYIRLGARGRVHAVAIAIREGLIE